MTEYNFKEIEQKWQKYWEDNKVFEVSNHSNKPKYYIMDMFPYPSGSGLHVGHPLGYIASDIVTRYKRLMGYNVLHPMGFDSFGLPAEQYAIQTGQHPSTTTEDNINQYKKQLKALGLSYNWSREIKTSDPEFYKWTQWIFKLIYNSWYNKDTDKSEHIDTLITILKKEGNVGINASCDRDTPIISAKEWNDYLEEEQQFFLLKYRLVYRAHTTVNWCPELGTVLSNDEVKDGFSERGGHPVVKKKMVQWNMRITAYADRLLSGLEQIDWPRPIKEMQRNWIGKSYGVEIGFRVGNIEQNIRVFTTRVDTIFGVSFIVLAPENELVGKLTKINQKQEVENYVISAKNRPERERISDTKNITGVFTGSYVIHPFTKKNIPIWIADYVLAGYGTGAVMAVPSGDQRDFNFAKKFNLPILLINNAQVLTQTEADSTKDGKIINSDFLNGLTPTKAMERGVEEIEKQGIGIRKTNFKLRDAVFSRQRYWGEPIPVYYENGIPKLIPNDNLPLSLPEIDEYLPTDDGKPPLGRAKKWNYCNNLYELSTMPGWAGSSWYFFRYMDPHNKQEFCSKKAINYWKDVDLYIGGSEHATGHLLYSRFWTKFLYDMNLIEVDEYAKKLVNQGMIQGRSSYVYRLKGKNRYISKGLKDQYNTTSIHVDINIVKNDILNIEAFKKFYPDAVNAEFVLEDGKYYCGWEIEKMSKSKYNVVNPDRLTKKYGADTLRMYEMFLGPIEQSKPWNTNGIEGVHKFLKKFWALFHKKNTFNISNEKPTEDELKVLHSAIKKISEDIENLSLNTSVSTFMITVNKLSSFDCNKRAILEPLTILLAPFAPHLSEELWHLLGNNTSITDTQFPIFKEKYLVENSIEYPISVNGKVRTKIRFSVNANTQQIQDEVLANKIIQKWMDGKEPQKIIVILKKIVNIVV